VRLNLGRGLDFPHPSRPASSSYTMGTGSFPGGKAAGAWHSSTTPFYHYLKPTPPFSALLSCYSVGFNKRNQTTKCAATKLLTYDTISILPRNQLYNFPFCESNSSVSLYVVQHFSNLLEEFLSLSPLAQTTSFSVINGAMVTEIVSLSSDVLRMTSLICLKTDICDVTLSYGIALTQTLP
jgi:hypothetical protein